MKNCPEIAAVKDILESANEALELLADMDSWSLINDEDDIATFSQGSDVNFIVRAEMLVDCAIFPILSLFSEIDLVPSWVELLKDARVISEPSTFTKLLWYKMNLPWPCNDRDMICRAVGIPIPDNNSVLVTLKSLEAGNYLGTDVPEPADGEVRMICKRGCINLMYLGPEKTQVSFIVHTDPQMNFIPQPLVNFGVKHGIYYFMKNIRDKAMHFKGSEFERRVQQKTEYYEKIEKFLKSNIKE